MQGPDISSMQAERLLVLQRSEITEHHIYTKIAAATPEPGSRDVLSRIAAQELEHYGIWKRYTGQEVAPDKKRIWFYYLVARIFGMTFAIKLMEGMEQRAQSVDQSFMDIIPEMPQMLADERNHNDTGSVLILDTFLIRDISIPSQPQTLAGFSPALIVIVPAS